MKTLLAVVFWLGSLLYLPAQPQTDPIRTVKNIAPTTSVLMKKRGELMKNRSEGASTLTDSIALEVVGQEVTASYLVDRHGEVWNLGVMELPFVIYTFMNRPSNIVPHIAAINTVANEYADEMVTFVLLPPSTNPGVITLLEGFNDNVIVLFDDHLHTKDHSSEESCLWGLTSFWPTTYFITAKRRIVGLEAGAYAYIQPKSELARINNKFTRNGTKSLRKQVKQLLKHG